MKMTANLTIKITKGMKRWKSSQCNNMMNGDDEQKLYKTVENNREYKMNDSQKINAGKSSRHRNAVDVSRKTRSMLCGIYEELGNGNGQDKKVHAMTEECGGCSEMVNPLLQIASFRME